MPITAEGAPGRRLALVVATGSYADTTLAKLRAPGSDASDLASVLEDEAVGGFTVETLLDAPAESLRRRVAQFCAQADPSDLVLVYLSCHGVLDDRGRLYYATVDTDRTLLSATAVSSAWLNEQLDDCRCRRQILVLDCCHSGAFAKGAKGEGSLALRERFEGRGRLVLTGSRGTEYSFEHGRVLGSTVSSVFTEALVEGLRSGDADRDGDGMITIGELYDYAYERVRAKEPRQTPTLWAYGAEGDLLIANSPRGAVVKPAPLPEDLLALLESARPRVRESAVSELAELLTGSDAGRALTARAELERVAAKDVPNVVAAARAALDAAPAVARTRHPRPGAPALQSFPPTTGQPGSTATESSDRRRIVIAGAVGTAIIIAVVLALLASKGRRPSGSSTTPLASGAGRSSSGHSEFVLNGSPRGVAVGDGITWVTRYQRHEVNWIDQSSTARSVQVADEPAKLAVGQGSVWVSVSKNLGLARIVPSTPTPTVGEEVPFDVAGCANCTIRKLAIARGALWVGSADGHSIAKLNLHTGELRASFTLGSRFEGVFAVGEDAVWAVENHDRPRPPDVVRLDLNLRSPERITFKAGEKLSGIASGDGMVWVADAGDRNVVTALDPRKKLFRKPGIKVKGVSEDDITVTGNDVLVWNTWAGLLARINADRMQLVGEKRIPHYTIHSPENLNSGDLAAEGGFAWITAPKDNRVYKIKISSIQAR